MIAELQSLEGLLFWKVIASADMLEVCKLPREHLRNIDAYLHGALCDKSARVHVAFVDEHAKLWPMVVEADVRST